MVKIKKKTLKIIGIIFLLIIISFLFLKFKPSKYDSFAKCLSYNGAVMYGTGWCSHCDNQKKSFGKSFKFIDSVNCDYNKVKCDENNITGFPTWVINDEKYPGEQSFETLSELTGCAIN
jgi:hypothetical protein